jgi:hypothetical protein
MHISTNPGRELLKDIFGIRPIKHPYLRCEECGKEYYKFRPLYCRGCGFAGGAIISPAISMIRTLIKNDIRKKYTYEINEYVPSNKTNKCLCISAKSKKAHPELEEIEQKIDDEFSAMIEPYKIVLDQHGPNGVIDQAKSYIRHNQHMMIETPRVLALLLCALPEGINLAKCGILDDEQEE